MSGAVRYTKLEWNQTTAFTLKQGLRDANTKVLVYRGDGVATHRLLYCGQKGYFRIDHMASPVPGWSRG